MSVITLPQPLAADTETVTVSRAAWDALVAQVEFAEDLAAADRFAAKVAERGIAEVTRLAYTADEVQQVLDGTTMVAIWRRRVGFSQKALAAKAGVSASYLAEIEGGKKPGSVAALSALAKALGVPLDTLVD